MVVEEGAFPFPNEERESKEASDDLDDLEPFDIDSIYFDEPGLQNRSELYKIAALDEDLLRQQHVRASVLIKDLLERDGRYLDRLRSELDSGVDRLED